MDSQKLQIIPLGGVMEIGKNMTAYQYNDRILIVDAGLMFPDEDMLGVDIVIPDTTFLEENAEKILGIVLTHGHEDHIGALPYVLRRLDVPVWGTPLTLGFVMNKLSEHHLDDVAQLYEVNSGDIIEVGEFTVEFVRVSHSIPDASGLVIKTPVGTIVHSSDFKFDQTPIDGHLADVSRLAKIGEDGVLAFLCDSTNVEKPGFTPSESMVGDTFEKIFAAAKGRIIIAAFASNIHRIQQVYNIAAHHGRRVAVVGRSMAENCRIAEELGYLKVPKDTRLQLNELYDLSPSETVIVTTGSQGEPLSALSRMASDEHKQIKIDEGDTVIISATPIPGNEDLIMRTINRLFRQGADVIYEPYTHVHVSGHGNQEDIRLMLNLLKPKYIIPVHGEQRHYAKFVDLADGLGYSSERVFRMYPGDVFETDGESAEVTEKVSAGTVMVDGLGVGDVEDVVLRDRKHLSQDGVLIAVIGIDHGRKEIVSGPDILSRGFVGEELGVGITEEAKSVLLTTLQDLIEDNGLEGLDDVKAGCRKALAKFIYERTHRRPMIVPVVMEV
ncbi:ribonuclease J [bacterium]|nr:ribonuclease J [bacterium]